jgi:hypothetical protein
MKPPNLRKRLAPYIAGLLSSSAAHRLRCTIYELKCRAVRRRHEIFFFDDLADPYSCLLAQVLPLLAEAYDVELKRYLVPPDPKTTPQSQILAKYALYDAANIATFYGLEFD